MPEDLNHERLDHVKIDSQGHIWVFGNNESLPVGVLAKDLGSWEVYPTLTAARQARPGQCPPQEDDPGEGREQKLRLPEDFRPQNLRNPDIVRDNTGTLWVAGDGRLFRYHHGTTVDVFSGGKTHPFISNPGLNTVRIDRHANTWLHPQRHSHWHVRIPPPAIAATVPSLFTDPQGRVRVEHHRTLIEWKLPNGSWEAAPDGKIGFLPPGEHNLEVQSFTNQLDRIGPFKVKISVPGTRQQQFHQFTEFFTSGPDELREDAVLGFVRQPEPAIAFLETFLKTHESWWARAALEECLRAPRAENRAP
jgi:hypothetical protein